MRSLHNRLQQARREFSSSSNSAGLIVRTSLREITFTTANSSSEANTKTRHIDIHTSMALMYDTLGRELLAPVLWVVMASTVSNPSDTLAGIASILIQKATHDKIT